MKLFILKFFKLINKQEVGFIGLLLLPAFVFASNFQIFTGINYSNPADLMFQVQDTQLIMGIGILPPGPEVKFKGKVIVPDPSDQNNNIVTSGTASNFDTGTYPYGRIAKRLSDQWVIGFDVTTPFSSTIKYPTDSPVRYSVTNSLMNSLDLAPNIAHKFTGKLSKLALGAGLDAMYYSITLDSKFPSPPTPVSPFGSDDDLNIHNYANNWGFGWHVGADYQLFKTTIVGISYFSSVTQNFRNGISSVTGFPTSDTFATTLNLPATSSFNILQFLSRKWSVNFRALYSEWDSLQQVVLKNTSGPENQQLVNLFYKNTWRVELGTRYDINSKLTLGALAAYDETPTSNAFRTLALPGVNQTILGTSAIYKLKKNIDVELDYGHIFSINAPVDFVDPNTGVMTDGTVNVSGNYVGVQFTVNSLPA